ncbi:peptidase inhibitor family I36 protein [Streptomyces sp. NPDC057020]|uniref:peptidase inhibitor family I36 protein n=1 Tax=Streptomyces sp. NPDC057020 TaxID=3346002 RepID=UPI003643F1F3
MRNTLFQRAAALAATLGLASLGLLGAGATPAQAATSDCPKGYFCAWANTNGTGAMFKTKTSVPTLGSWDNKIRLRYNRTGLHVCMYDQQNYGRSGGLSWDSPDQNVPTSGGSDEISSVRIVPALRDCEADPYPYWESKASSKAGGFGDMNGDRRADVLLRDEAGRLWFLTGQGTGRLIGFGGWRAFDALARHGDFSRDGREDVIAREKATGKLWLYPGTGNGSLGARKLIGSGGWNSMEHIFAVGDTSGDGRPDMQASGSGRLYEYQGLSSGGLRKVDHYNYSWWALSSATAF